MWIELVRSRALTFTNVKGSSSLEQLLSEALASADWESATLVVRVEQCTIGTDATLTFQAYAEWPDESELRTIYVETTPMGTPISLGSTATSPALHRALLFDNHDAGTPLLRITAKATQPATPVTVQVTISVGLVVHGR